MAEVNLTAAFSTIPGDEAEAIKRLLTEIVEQLAREDGGFTRAKLVFTESDERCGLTAELGTAGATHVRFLFGFPFALVFLAVVVLAVGQALPHPPSVYWPWVILGALAQIAATALMLAAMNDRSFVVVYAYIKTEPVQAALFGLVFLGDAVTPGMAAAILIVIATGFRCHNF